MSVIAGPSPGTRPELQTSYTEDQTLPIEAKRKALEAAYQDIVTSDLPEWNQDPGLIDWLTNL